MIATMAVSVVVAQRLGAAGQGFWVGFRTLFDFAAVIAAYGFPAAFPYLINVRKVAPQALLRFTVLYAAMLLPMVALLFALTSQWGLVHMQTSDMVTEAALLTVTSVALATHSMLRGLCLATSSSMTFNIVSTLLPLSLFVFFLVWPLSSPANLMWAAAAAAIFSLAASATVWNGHRDPALAVNLSSLNMVIPIRETFRFGGWNFAVSGLMAAAPLYIIQRLTASGVVADLIGCFSIALLVLGAMLTPANLAGPIVYNAWSRATDNDARLNSYNQLFRWATLVSAVLATTGWLLMPQLHWAFGSGFEAAVGMGRIMLLAVPLGYWSRIMCNVLLAAGAVRSYAAAVAAKLAAIVLVLELAVNPSAENAVIAWVVSEAIQLLCCAIAVSRAVNWTSWQIMGLSARATE